MDFDAAVAQLDQLVRTLEREGDDRALLLLELVDAVHRPALAAIVDGDIDHPAAQAVLQMYGLVEVEPELLAEEALDAVRPYIESHGGEVELLSVDQGVVRVRLRGSCVGCAGSAMTLKRGIEEALRESLPGFREVIAEEAEEEPPATAGPALPMAPAGIELPMVQVRRPVFVDVVADDELAEGQLLDVVADGLAILLARFEGEVYALRNGCAVDGLPLEGGRLTREGVLVCPWHNCAYDIRTGGRVDDRPDAPGLTVVPVALRDGAVKVAVNVA